MSISVRSDLENLFVRDLIFNDKVWNLDIVRGLLPTNLMESILATSIHVHIPTEGRLNWGSSSNGKYTAKSGYNWVSTTSSSND